MSTDWDIKCQLDKQATIEVISESAYWLSYHSKTEQNAWTVIQYTHTLLIKTMKFQGNYITTFMN